MKDVEWVKKQLIQKQEMLKESIWGKEVYINEIGEIIEELEYSTTTKEISLRRRLKEAYANGKMYLSNAKCYLEEIKTVLGLMPNEEKKVIMPTLAVYERYLQKVDFSDVVFDGEWISVNRVINYPDTEQVWLFYCRPIREL